MSANNEVMKKFQVEIECSVLLRREIKTITAKNLSEAKLMAKEMFKYTKIHKVEEHAEDELNASRDRGCSDREDR